MHSDRPFCAACANILNRSNSNTEAQSRGDTERTEANRCDFIALSPRRWERWWSAMSGCVRVAKTTELNDPGQMLLEVEDRILVLFKVDGQFFCIDDVCTHDGGPLSE